MELIPDAVIPDHPLAELTTVGTGGAAEFFAKANSRSGLDKLIAWAGANALPVAVLGRGSNLLVADEGVRGLVIKMDRELATIVPDGTRIRCGAGARLPRVAARAAALGLTGLEFGVNIPGSVGGAIRMNAGAYGGELGRVLAWVDVHSPAGRERRKPSELGFGIRCSNLRRDEIIAQAEFVLVAAPQAEVKARQDDLRKRRHEAQPKGIRTFGSTFKNPPGKIAGVLLAGAGATSLRVGGACFSRKHANFVENLGGATTADVVALMAEGRRLVAEKYGLVLEPEVHTLGRVHLPWELSVG